MVADSRHDVYGCVGMYYDLFYLRIPEVVVVDIVHEVVDVSLRQGMVRQPCNDVYVCSVVRACGHELTVSINIIITRSHDA